MREAFEYLDRDKDGYLTPIDLREALAERSYLATERELFMLIERLDRDKDGRISFEDFRAEMMPLL